MPHPGENLKRLHDISKELDQLILDKEGKVSLDALDASTSMMISDSFVKFFGSNGRLVHSINADGNENAMRLLLWFNPYGKVMQATFLPSRLTDGPIPAQIMGIDGVELESIESQSEEEENKLFLRLKREKEIEFECYVDKFDLLN